MKSIFCAALILFGFIDVFAQEKTISKAEFDAVYKNRKWAPDSWKGKSYRMTTTTQAKTEGKRQEASFGKTTIEFASPTVSRLITETSYGFGTTKSQSIRIGDKTYKRKGDEAWIVGTIEADSPPKTTDMNTMPVPADKQSANQTEYKYLGTEKLNNQITNVYAVVTKTKLSNTKILSVIATKYWFTEDGVLLRNESRTERRNGENKLYIQLITAWELDPNIKVEAPIMN